MTPLVHDGATVRLAPRDAGGGSLPSVETVARHERWRRARRILAVRLDQLGDVMMTTPALAALKRAAPDRHVTLLTSQAGAALAAHLPIDTAIGVDVPWMKPDAPMAPAEYDALIAELRSRGFDGAIIFTVHSQSALPAALLCYQAGIELRAAYCRENPYHLLSDRLPEQEPQLGVRHEVERQIALVRSLGIEVADTRLQFAIRDGDRAALARTLATLPDVPVNGTPQAPYIVLHPGASAASRRYPAENFGVALRLLAQRSPLPVFVTGSAAEGELARRVIAHAGERAHVHDLTGRLTVGELGALIDKAALLISNNTGPVHLAAAVGTPVVDLYALTNPQHTPWQVPARVLFHDVPCRYCMKSVCPEQHHACLRRVPPAAVAEAALQLLHAPRRPLARMPLAMLPRYRPRDGAREEPRMLDTAAAGAAP